MMTFFPRIYRPDGSATKTGIELAIQTLQTAKVANGAMYAPTSLTAADDQELPDLLNPAADPAVLGSTIGVDTNDPVVLPYDGTEYIYLPASTAVNNQVSASSAKVVSGEDIEFIWHGAFLGDPTTCRNEMGGHTSGGGWQLYMYDNTLRSFTSYTTTGNIFRTWNAPGIVAGEEVWFKMTRKTSTGAVNVYKSSNGIDWTSMGSEVIQAAGETLKGAGTSLTFAAGWGALGVQRNVDMKVFSITSGEIGSTPTASLNPDADGATQTGWISSSTAAETYTIARSTTGRKTAVVTRPVIMSDGTDDYGQLPASATPTFTATTGKHTMLLMWRANNVDDSQALYSSESAVNNGVFLFTQAVNKVRLQISGSLGNVSAFSNGVLGMVDNEFVVAAAIIDNGTSRVYVHGATSVAPANITGVGTITHAVPRIGHRITQGLYLEGELFAFLDFPGEALTDSELDALSEYLKAGAYL